MCGMYKKQLNLGSNEWMDECFTEKLVIDNYLRSVIISITVRSSLFYFGYSEPLLCTSSKLIWTRISILTIFLSTVVLVTGAGGFIATHIVKQLQEEGYRVRGTVRSLEDEERVKKLKELCPDAKHELELVEADLTKPESWEPWVQGF